MPFNPQDVPKSVTILKRRKAKDASIGIGARHESFPEINMIACVAVADPHQCPDDDTFYCSLRKRQLALIVWQDKGDLSEIEIRFKVDPLVAGSQWRIVDKNGKTIHKKKIGLLKPSPSPSFLAKILGHSRKSTAPQSPNYTFLLFDLANDAPIASGDGATITLEMVQIETHRVLAQAALRSWFA